MTRILISAEIACPVERAFAYVTTPANWPEWHVSSVGVSGSVDHSLEPGEQVTEEFKVAGHRGRVVWTVRERVPPSRWVIEGAVAGGGHGRISYTLRPLPDGRTGYEREFVYTMPNPLLAALDVVIFRRRNERESRESVARLKGVLERP
jgi:uncharacterized protein YndB with AHSA1/START domain